MQELKVQIANQEDADMGLDLLGLSKPADGGAGNPPAGPGAFGPAAGRVAQLQLLREWRRPRALLHLLQRRPSLRF